MLTYPKKYGKFLLLFSCLGSPLAFASQFSAISDSFISSVKRGHAVLEVGVYQGTQGKSQHINIDSLIGDNFTVSDHQDTDGLIGLGYFIDGQSYRATKFSYGINAFYLARTTVSGNVVQENLFNNLSYQYNLTNYPVYAMVKTTTDFDTGKLALIVDAGIGANFMHVYGFNETSLDGGITIPEKPFSSNTTTNFSATIGAGLKINHALGKYPVELGYRFYYLGEGNLDINNSQVINHLKTGNAYANAFIISVSC